MKTLFLGIIIFLIAAQGAAALRVLDPPEIRNKTATTPEFSCLPKKRYLEGYLFDARFTNISIEAIRANSSLVLIALVPSTILSTKLDIDGQSLLFYEALEKIGVDGLLNINTVIPQGGGGEVLIPDWSVCTNNPGFMWYEVGYVEGAMLTELVEKYGFVNVAMDLGDPNPWRDIRRGTFSIVWRVVFTSFSAVVAIAALTKLIAYVVAFGFQLSVPQVSLGILAVFNVFRTIYHALDPVYFGYAMNGPGAHMTSTITIPANIIATLLVAFYWSELLDRNKVQVSTFLSRMRIPFIIVSVLVSLVEIASSGLRASPLPNLGFMTVFAVVLYVLVVTSSTIFFTVTGTKVLLYIRKSTKMASLRETDKVTSRRLVRKAAMLLLTASAFNVVWVIALLLAGVPSFFWTPRGQYTSWGLVWIGLLGSNFAQILAFKFPRRGDTSGVSSVTNLSGSATPRAPSATASGNLYSTSSVST